MMYDHDPDNLHDEDLRQAARRVGHAAAERLDVEQTAQAVLTRLRAGETPARSPIRWLQPAWVRTAAAVVLTIGGGLLVYYRVKTPVVPIAAVTDSAPPVASELTGLSPVQLQDVIAALDEPVETPTVHAGEAGVEDLSAPELQSLLQAMED